MEEIKLNFLLMGKTGQGKSATGNTLLERPGFFKQSYMSTSETKDVKFSCREFNNYLLQVVDGPGLEDTDMDKVKDKETAIKHIETALAMCYGGVDAFLYVIKFGPRFTAEDRSALDSLKTIFGEDFLNHVVLVMTGGDFFEIEMADQPIRISFNEWCNKQEGGLKKLYDDCEGRVVLINNKEKDSEKKLEQIQEIIKHAHNLQEKNGRYTSQCFQLAEQARERMIVELKVPQLKREIQEKVTLLAADLEKYSASSSESLKNSIQVRIRELRKEIILQDKGYGKLQEMKKLTDEIEESLHDREKLGLLAKELEATKEVKEGWTAGGSFLTFLGGAAALAFLPVAAGAAAAAAVGVGIAGAVTTGIGYLAFDSKEKTKQQEHDELKKKIQK